MNKECWNKIEEFLNKGFNFYVVETTLDSQGNEIKVCSVNGILFHELEKTLESYFQKYDLEISPTEFFPKEIIKKISTTLISRNIFLESRLEYYNSNYDASKYPYNIEKRDWEYTNEQDLDKLLTSEFDYPIPYENAIAVKCIDIIKKFIQNLILLNQNHIISIDTSIAESTISVNNKSKTPTLKSFNYTGHFEDLKKCYNYLITDGYLIEEETDYKLFKKAFSNTKLEQKLNWHNGPKSLHKFIRETQDKKKVSKRWILTALCFKLNNKEFNNRYISNMNPGYKDPTGNLTKAIESFKSK